MADYSEAKLNDNRASEEKDEISVSLSRASFSDDIDCMQWLSEIGLQQYCETFLMNLSADGKVIRRKRLTQLRQQDLSSMNITNYVHQKRLMEHIRLVLRYAFNSPVRKKEVKPLPPTDPVPAPPALAPDSPSADSKTSKTSKTSISAKDGSDEKKGAKEQPKKDIAKQMAEAKEKKKTDRRRRRSFDSSVWNSISTSRKKAESVALAATSLREGNIFKPEPIKKQGSRGHDIAIVPNASPNKAVEGPATNDTTGSGTGGAARRWSFNGGADLESHSKQMERAKAIMYGNTALEYDIMLSSLDTLQNEYLNKFKNTINCEIASIFFLNDDTQELLLHSTNGKWYRIPIGVGIAGHCAATGESLNIADAYKDHRFNRNMDLKTGLKTRNILCQPVRSMRGGGPVVGVIQMLNKVGADAFDGNDEETLASCVQSIADVLSVRFMGLMDIARRFAGHAIFVGSKGGDAGSGPSYTAPTKSSQSKPEEK